MKVYIVVEEMDWSDEIILVTADEGVAVTTVEAKRDENRMLYTYRLEEYDI